MSTEPIKFDNEFYGLDKCIICNNKKLFKKKSFGRISFCINNQIGIDMEEAYSLFIEWYNNNKPKGLPVISFEHFLNHLEHAGDNYRIKKLSEQIKHVKHNNLIIRDGNKRRINRYEVFNSLRQSNRNLEIINEIHRLYDEHKKQKQKFNFYDRFNHK